MAEGGQSWQAFGGHATIRIPRTRPGFDQGAPGAPLNSYSDSQDFVDSTDKLDDAKGFGNDSLGSEG